MTMAGAMTYSREHPSPRYRELMAMYRQMHVEGDRSNLLPPEQTFYGRSLPEQAVHIKKTIEAVGGVDTLLDYGSGKGMQYRLSPVSVSEGGQTVQWPSFQAYWGVRELRCYDPGYQPFSELPAGRFDGVICTDVLEHCPEEDIPWIVEELFRYAKKFVYANVACYPARKRLPNGENAHCTIKPVDWWKGVIRGIAARYPTLYWQFRFSEPIPEGKGMHVRIFSNLKIN